ncbi:MAG: hypothetical protein HYT98_01635 [Candidatus Sungbacteria bacterium]|nr:hypothetical protein [Candidatus Sungbacteria bacterium]
MPTITIPKEFTKSKNLIAVTPNMYEEFLQWQKWVKSSRTFKPTAGELRELARARRDFSEGKFIKWEDLKHELALIHTRKSKKAI